MRTKATFLVGFATGYVLGSKAGRARYEQIRETARSFASNPTVQSTTASLTHQAEDALSSAKDKAAASLGSTLQDKRPSWLGGTEAPAASTPPGPTAGSNGSVR